MESSLPSSIKFPSVARGRNSLVSSSSVVTSDSENLPCLAAAWAKNVRRKINKAMHYKEDIQEEDISILKKELNSAFHISVQQNSHFGWKFLSEVLDLVEPYKGFLGDDSSQSQLYPHVELILNYECLNRGHLLDVQMKVMNLFPELVKKIQSKMEFQDMNHTGNTAVQITLSARKTKGVHKKTHLRKSVQCNKIPIDESIPSTTQLTLRHLSQSLSFVTSEIASQETVWRKPLGTTALAMSTFVPKEIIDSKHIEDILGATATSHSLELVMKPSKLTTQAHTPPKFEEDIPTMNGREAVQYFTSCGHLGQMRSLVFNLAPNRHYNPYDLIAVPKCKVEPQHYIFSSFGVMHVFPDRPSESLSLGQWQREAVLWTAVSCIPFFKHFLTNKAFYRWRSNCQQSQFQQRRKQIRRKLLTAIPSFGTAILQISKLLQELLTVPILQVNAETTYSLIEFENCIHCLQFQGGQLLERFFRLFRLTLDALTEEVSRRVHYCEKQVRKRKNYQSKDSMALQKKKLQDRVNNLKLAKSEMICLGTLVKLLDQMVMEHLFEITKSQTVNFVGSVLDCPATSVRDAFFKADLVFSHEGNLQLSPPQDCFHSAIDSALHSVPNLLMSKVAEAMHPEDELTNGQFDVERDRKVSLTAESATETKHDTLESACPRCLYPSENVTKEKEDNPSGTATPDLVIMHAEDFSPGVKGQTLCGQYAPLSTVSLREKLLKDETYQAALKRSHSWMSAAFKEIDNFCEKNQWLKDVHQCCVHWTETSALVFKDAPAASIERKLKELNQWSEKVEGFYRNFYTENGSFCIDCSQLRASLLVELARMYQDVYQLAASEAHLKAATFASDMNTVLHNMANKSLDISSFAAYAKNIKIYQKNTVNFQQQIDYIRSLYEVLRSNPQQLRSEDIVPFTASNLEQSLAEGMVLLTARDIEQAPAEENVVEEKLLSLWQTFQEQIQDASQFVTLHMLDMKQQLEDSLQILGQDAARLAELTTTGQFVNPSPDSYQILNELKAIQEKFDQVKKEIHQTSGWKEAITDESHSLIFLEEMSLKIDVRQELWNYVEAFRSTIEDWKCLSFRKMNITKAQDKLTEWQQAAQVLKSLLPEGDCVLTSWCQQMQTFAQDLPLLNKLMDSSLQERHWQSLFLAWNRSYDANHELKVADLLSIHLSQHADLIQSTHRRALAECVLEQNLKAVSSFWQTREFRLTKYIPTSLMSVSNAQRTSSSNKRLRKLEQFRQQRTASFQRELKRLDVTNDDLFVLSDLDELTYDLEDSRISVEAMLTFPHVEHIRDQVVSWQRVLRSIQEITEVWAEAQKKWQYLLKIFQQPKLYQQLPEQAAKFEESHSKFKEWMRVVSSDPKCLSVVGRQRKEKGYRLLQGDNLKTLLMFVMTEQEEILKHLDKFLEKSRTIFPRLYFLNDGELIDLLGVFGNLPATVPFVQKCFPAVQDLHFSLPADLGDKLDVISVTGKLEEEISLCRPVVAVPSASRWLQAFCATFKDTLTISLRSCVQNGMEEGLGNVLLALENLSQLCDSKDRKVSSSLCHWLVRFPNQCVITAQAVIWTREMTRILEQQLMQELRIMRSNLNAEISQMSQVLQAIKSHKKIRSSDGQRLQLLVCGLLCQSIYQRDIMTGLIDSKQVTETAFDWLKILKFFMEVHNVLRAKTVLPESSSSAHIMKANSIQEVISSDNNSQQTNKASPGEAPGLGRALTTISTDQQFGACYIQQLNHVFSYDYEYLGPRHHLVVTPLTERAFLTLGHALSKFQCGTLVGPSGTGKSATIRELAGLLGRTLFMVNCGQDMTLSAVVQNLTGMVQSGCWALFDNCDKMSNGLLSAVGQQLDYLSSALRALSVGCTNQYQVRGHSHFDKVFSVKSGTGDKVIRRNSLTTLHPLPREAVAQPSHSIQRQKSVPHGFNEQGLVTYFEDTWVAERDKRQQSVEREIEIIESDLYRNNKPPSLLYEHVKISKKRPTEDFSRLAAEPLYVHKFLGNVMFDGKLIAASSNFGCFMTLEAEKLSHLSVPATLTMQLRPCAFVVPDLEYIISVTLESYGYLEYRSLSKKLIWLVKSMDIAICSEPKLRNCIRTIKKVLLLAAGKKIELLSKTGANKPFHDTSFPKDLLKSVEESSMAYSVKETFGSYFDAGTDYLSFLGLCRDAFPVASESDVLEDQTLMLSLIQLFKDNNLEKNKSMIDKILQLYAALEIRAPVLLVGPPGCGKSQMCSVLAGVINSLHHQVHQPDHPTKGQLQAEQSHLHFQLPRKLRLLKELDRKLKSDHTDESEETSKQEPHGPFRQTKAVKRKEETAQSSSINIAAHKKIDILHLLPCAMSPSELLGAYDRGTWHGGLLGAVLRQWQGVEIFMKSSVSQQRKTQTTAACRLHRWLVLDGDLDPSWTEGIKNMVGDTNCLTLGNGERLFLKDSVTIIFETCSLQKACPATVSSCQVVHCGTDCNTWTALYFTWRQTASTKWFIPTDGLNLLDELVKDIFPATVDFLRQEESSSIHVDFLDSDTSSGCAGPGITQVSAFLSILSALLDRLLRRGNAEKVWLSPPAERPTTSLPSSHEETSIDASSCSVPDAAVPHYTEILKGLFVYSYIWAFGGSLHDRFKEKFINQARHILLESQHSFVLPQDASVFDYCFDVSMANFVTLSSHRLKNHLGFILTPQVESYINLMDVLVAAQRPVLLVGAPGVGKTSMVKHLLQSKTSSKSVNMSRSVTSTILLKCLKSATMEKQQRDHVSAQRLLVGRAKTKDSCLFFIDDLNMAPAISKYQPSLELVRSVLTLGGTYDSERRNFLEMSAVTFIAAAAGPLVSGNQHGSWAIPARLSRHFVTLTVHTPSSDSLCGLYTYKLHSWLEEFPSFSSQHHSQLAKTMSLALLEVYNLVRAQLAPTPLLPHYVFTLHDVAHVVHGILLMSSRTSIKKSVINCHEAVDVKNPMVFHRVMTQLWCHEVSRCFRDRMMRSQDQTWFNQIVEETISKHFHSYSKSDTIEDSLKPKDSSKTGDLQSVEKLTDARFIIFSRFFMTVDAKNHEPHTEKDYTQQTESMLAAALRGCLEKYNYETCQQLKLVFYTQAVHHAARISRVLAYPGGHAILLSTGHCTGRRSLVRLAAFTGQCQVFEPRPQLRDTQNLATVLVELKLACFHAGVKGKPAALLVHEDLGEACFQVVNDVIAGGWVPGLYTDQEVEEIASCLLPGGIQTKRVDQIEQAFLKFLRRVRQNLHVFICLKYTGIVDHRSTHPSRLHHILQTYPCLLKNCFNIDVYHPWSHATLARVATSWLQEAGSEVTVPWTGQLKFKQIEVASRAMAYIHLSAIAAWRKQCPYHPDLHSIFSPLKFKEFIHLFKSIALSLLQAEKLKGERYEKALAKIDEAFGSIEEYKRKVSDLMPMSSTAGGTVHDLVAEVETLKSNYKQALDKCKQQEEKIIRLQAPLEKLQSATQTEFNKVNPTYQAAVTVLNTLDQNAVEEIRSYSSPPEGVRLVMRAVCMLFRKPQTWEHAKTLLVDAGFFQELIFYRKDSMAEDIFKELKNFITNPDFTPESVAQASSAAASVCAWIHALFAYINIHQNMRPHMRNLAEVESNLRNAQAELGHLRLEAHRLKADLQQYISQHKQALKVARAFEKQIQVIERKIARANDLMENMSVQHFLWRSELKRSRRQQASALGDGLISAAFVIYLAPFSDRQRSDLLHDWLNHLRQDASVEESDPGSVEPEVVDFELLGSVGQEFDHKISLSTSEEKVADADIVLLLSQVKTCRYSSVVYDTSDYYKYELTRPDTVQTTVPESSMDDSDDEDTCILPIRSNFAIQEILSNFDELIEWRKHNIPTDLRSIQNALILNICHQKGQYGWPLLIDPDEQAVVWLRTLLQGHMSTQKQVEAIDSETSSLLSGYHSPADLLPSRETTLETEGGTHKSDSSSNSSLNSARIAEESSSRLKQHNNIANFQVIMADDPDIVSKLVNAVIFGTTVLISHLERKPLEPALTSLMLRQLCTNKDGSKAVMIGDTLVTYNPSFCLFLSTSVPLYVKGDGFYNMPLNQTFIVDLALSDEASMNILMLETIKVEKKEFEGQKRANENYLIQHRQSLAREHEIIREKTLNLAGPLLEDETMLESLKKCQDNLEHNRQFFEDTLYMGDHLEDKFSHYKPFIKHSTMLYRVLQRMQLVCPHYYVPFAKFKEIFVAVITSKDRGKGSRGATQARAQELSNGVLKAVLSFVQLLMSEQHFMLLLLFLSLERQLLYHRASRKELGFFVYSFLRTGPVSADLLKQKPDWLSDLAWINCHILQSLHQPFTGLVQSLITNSHPWCEYLQKKISLLSSLPGLVCSELSIFQKCILWKIVRPQRMAELVECFVTCELGSAVPHSDSCDMHEIYKLTHKNTPTILLLPPSQKTHSTSETMGPQIFNPVVEIKKAARENGMEGKVRLLNLAVVSNLSEVSGALTDCMQLGHWLLLLNYHLCQEQDPHFLTVLQDIIDSGFQEESTQPQGGDNDETRTSMSSLVKASSIHNSFRLWLTTCSGHIRNNSQWRLMPGLVVQHGLKVTLEAASDFGQLLSRTFKSVASFLHQDSSNELQPVSHKTATALALLHSIILYNCHITHHNSICQHLWSLTDLATAVEIIQTLPDWTSDLEAINDLAASIYIFHCVDSLDATFVASMARDLIQCSSVPKEKTECGETSAVQHMCIQLMQSMETTGDVHKRLASQHASSHLTSLISEETKQAFLEHNSRILHEGIHHFLGNPELHDRQVTLAPNILINFAEVVKSLQALLSMCPEMPDYECDRRNPLDIFFSKEYLGYSELFENIQADLNLLHGVLEGEITATPHMQDMLDEFNQDKVPTRWQQNFSVPCSRLREWLSELPEKMNYIKTCLSQDLSNLALNMFLHPDRLLYAIRQTFAAVDSSCAEKASLRFEVIPRHLTPAPVDPMKEIHITGLQIRNASWNSSTSTLTKITEWGSEPATCPNIVVRPCNEQEVIASSQQHDHYMCPVYSVRDWWMHSDQNLLCWIPLKTLVPSQQWAQKCVALTLAKLVSSSN